MTWFVGPIPGSFGELFSLDRLLLSSISLTRSIPSTLGHCSRLRLLDLSWNQLFGSVLVQIFEIEALEIALTLSWTFMSLTMDESRKLVKPVNNDAGPKSSYCKPVYVLVIGATNRLDAIDLALRILGRFDCEVVLGVPDEYARMKILSKLTCNCQVEGTLDFKVIDLLIRAACIFMESVNAWRIKDKIFSVTLIDVCEYDGIVEDIKNVLHPILDGKVFRVRCACHALNSCVRDGLGFVSEHVAKIRSGVELQVCYPELFVKLCERYGLKFITLDDESRWGSTRKMLESCLANRDVLLILLHLIGVAARMVF